MIHAPFCFGSAGRPVVFGSKGHKIFQCGGSVIGVPEMAYGSVALQSEPPCNMYSMPGSVLVGLGCKARKSLSLLFLIYSTPGDLRQDPGRAA